MDFFQHLGGFVLIIDHLRTPQILAKVVQPQPFPGCHCLGGTFQSIFQSEPKKKSINEFKYHFGRILWVDEFGDFWWIYVLSMNESMYLGNEGFTFAMLVYQREYLYIYLKIHVHISMLHAQFTSPLRKAGIFVDLFGANLGQRNCEVRQPLKRIYVGNLVISGFSIAKFCPSIENSFHSWTFCWVHVKGGSWSIIGS